MDWVSGSQVVLDALNDELDKVRVPINKDTDEQVADLLFGVFVG